jgi:hypothetical protein
MTTEDTIDAPNVTTKLRQDVFNELCQDRDLTTTAAIAKHIGVSEKTVSRVAEQGGTPSGTFIARTLARWPRCSFRSLFAVVDETTGKEMR